MHPTADTLPLILFQSCGAAGDAGRSAALLEYQMNHIISIALLLIPIQTMPAARSERLEGAIVKYVPVSTSQVDFIVKLKTNAGKKYIRLRYSPNGFGFDAPPAEPEQLAPEAMFSDGSLIWIIQAHSPHNPEEQSACAGQVKRYVSGKDGRLMKVERFVPVPDYERESIPKPESLPCLIMEGWKLKEN